jgi:hypothetical protein
MDVLKDDGAGLAPRAQLPTQLFSLPKIYPSVTHQDATGACFVGDCGGRVTA